VWLFGLMYWRLFNGVFPETGITLVARHQDLDDYAYGITRSLGNTYMVNFRNLGGDLGWVYLGYAYIPPPNNHYPCGYPVEPD